MGARAQELARRIAALNDEIVGFVESCSAQDWRAVTAAEGWSVGVVTHHVAAIHYGVLDAARRIVAGQPLPERTREGLHQLTAEHAQEHADCTRAEVLGLLRDGGAAIVDYVNGLSDADLDRSGYVPLAGAEKSTQARLEYVILRVGGEHLASAKAALER